MPNQNVVGSPLTTLYYRDHRRPSIEAKAKGQLYLTPLEEKALQRYLKLIANFGNPVRIKYLPALAFSIARQRSTNKATKPPSKNWPLGFQKRHPVLTVQFLDERKTLGFPETILNKAKFPMPAKLQRWDERCNRFGTCYIPLNRTRLVFRSEELIAELITSEAATIIRWNIPKTAGPTNSKIQP